MLPLPPSSRMSTPPDASAESAKPKAAESNKVAPTALGVLSRLYEQVKGKLTRKVTLMKENLRKNSSPGLDDLPLVKFQMELDACGPERKRLEEALGGWMGRAQHLPLKPFANLMCNWYASKLTDLYFEENRLKGKIRLLQAAQPNEEEGTGYYAIDSRDAHLAATLEIPKEYGLDPQQVHPPENGTSYPSLGKGKFGEVYRGEYASPSSTIPVALKTCADTSEKAVQEFEAEMRLYEKIPVHPNLVRFIGVTHVSDADRLLPAAVTDYCNHGDLKSFLAKGKWAQLSLDQQKKLVQDIVRGVAYLNQQGIVHRDLALRNILIHEEPPGNFTAKIGDFGMSLQLPKEGELVKNNPSVFPVRWMAPETLYSGRAVPYSSKSDGWSLGAALVELYTGNLYPGITDNEKVAVGVRKGETNPLQAARDPSKVPEWLKEPLEKCFAMDRATRFSAAQVLERLS